MECFCVRQTDVPGTSKLFADLIYHFDRVADLYPFPPNDLQSLIAASRFDFPAERRAELVKAITPLNEGNPSLGRLAKPGTVAIVTGQQVGLFSGPAYTVYKALTAIKAARALTQAGVEAVPVFWLATEDHDFAEIDHTWVFGADHRPVEIRLAGERPAGGSRPVGPIAPGDFPIEELRRGLAGLPFADETVDLVERAYSCGATMGVAFGHMIAELMKPYGMLLVDPLAPGLIAMRTPLMKEAVQRTDELTEALKGRSKELESRGYHAQVLVDQQSSLVFLLEGGERIALRHRKLSARELADRAQDLSPNALLRPVVQDYMIPTAAYIGGPAELAYLAQSQVLYRALLDRQPAAFPRAFFTLLDERSRKRMTRYQLGPTDLFASETAVRERIASRLVPAQLRARLDQTRSAFTSSLDALSADLKQFDVSLASALDTSRRKIEHQVSRIERKTAAQILMRDAQAGRDAQSLSGLIFPEKHLQERLYSIVPFLAKYGPSLIGEIESAVRIDCPDHQCMVV
jgi:bacillithiol biosynthesis cysteine-adding enzyme BshC